MVVVLFLVLSGVSSAQGNSDSAFARVKEVQERHTEKLMAKEGVVGTAVGLNDKGQPAVVVLLARPGVAGIAPQLDGVPVRLVVTGEFHALKASGKPINPRSWFPRPVPIGVSTGLPDMTSGTIACRVKKSDGSLYALSGNYTYANLNRGVIGTDHVLQPSPYFHGRDPRDAIGTLSDFEPILLFPYEGKLITFEDNTIYGAIAAIMYDGSTPRVGNATPSDGYGTPSSTPVTPYIGQSVQKYGAGTALTKGTVELLNATVFVDYGDVNGDGFPERAKWVNQIMVTPGVGVGAFAFGGDDGSLIVTQEGNHPIGLLHTGSEVHVAASPIDAVLTRFGVTVDGL
jgi:hypothetical protein